MANMQKYEHGVVTNEHAEIGEWGILNLGFVWEFGREGKGRLWGWKI